MTQGTGLNSPSHPPRAKALHRRKAARSDSVRFEKLYELFARLAARNDLDSALQEVLDASIDVVGGHAGLIRLFYYEEVDPIASRLPFVAHRGISEGFLNYFSNLDQPLSREGRQAMYDGHRLLIEDMISHEYYQDHREVVVAEGYRTQLSIPLMRRIGPKCVGVLTTFFREIQTPRDADLETLNLYAELAAMNIDQHQHAAELVRRSRSWASIAEEQAGVIRWTRERLSELEETAPGLYQDMAQIARSIESTLEALESARPSEAVELPEDQHADNSYGLSSSELAVLINVWRGLPDKESAAQMGVSRFTVAKYLASAMRKLNVEDRIQASIVVGRDIMSNNDALDLSFSDLLRQFRRRVGLTQLELAEKASLSYRTISDLERGVRTKVYASTVGLISDALDLLEDDANWLAASVDRSRRPRLDGQHLDRTSLK